MRQSRRIVLFELNEVPFRILDDFSRSHPRSHLARLLARASQYETVARDDPDLIPHGHLSPWITWPTLHRGVVHAQHQVTHLGQDLSAADRAFPPIWQLLAERGVRSGVFGSLHSYPLPDDLAAYDFYLPDSFAAGAEAYPAAFESFQDFNLAMVSASGRNVPTQVAWKPAGRFLRDARGLGLLPGTIRDLARQLVDERLRPWVRTRRRTYQAVLAFDLFMQQLERSRPAFSTFFSNHVAATLHRYWAAAFPEDYEAFDLEPEWVRRYRGEIDFSMMKLDGLLGRLARFVDANPDHVLLVTSSMGQAATAALPLETQLTVRQPERLMAALSVRPGEWLRRQAMEPDFNVFVAPEAVDDFRARLATLRIAGKPIRCDEQEGGFFSLAFGHADLPDDTLVELDARLLPLASLGLENVLTQDRSSTTAFHVADGHLLLYDPRNAEPDQARDCLSTVELAPCILRNFGIEPPGYMWSSGTLERSLGGFPAEAVH